MNHPSDPKDDGGRVPGFTYAWMIPYLSRIGRQHGYAMAFHGTMSRDMDVVAVPWVETSNPPEELLKAICELTHGTLQPDDANTDRPHGRKAYTITFAGAWHFLDISIMPLS